MAALLMMTTAGILPLSAKVHVDDIYEMSLDENLMTPEIKNDKQADRIQEFQYNMAVAFKQTNYDVEIMRDDEVIVITIPASQLFDPNDTVLNKLGEEQLKPFLRMPYALGETDPIVDNNSVESRKTNRRLEIFLIPEQTMLQQAKKGRINMSQMGKK